MSSVPRRRAAALALAALVLVAGLPTASAGGRPPVARIQQRSLGPRSAQAPQLRQRGPSTPSSANLLKRGLARPDRPRPGRLGALARGSAIEGPRHTWAAMRKNPTAFVAGAALIGLGGSLSYAAGVPLVGEAIALGISTIALAVQLRGGVRLARASSSSERWRHVGAQIVWPTFLFAATIGLGHLVGKVFGHGAHPPSATDIAVAGGKSVLIGSDAPAISVTALETLRGQRGQRAPK